MLKEWPFDQIILGLSSEMITKKPWLHSIEELILSTVMSVVLV